MGQHGIARRQTAVVRKGDQPGPVPVRRIPQQSDRNHRGDEQNQIAAQVGQPRGQVNAPVIDDGLREQQGGHTGVAAGIGMSARGPVKSALEKIVGPGIHGGDDRNQADEIEPSRGPAPAPATENRSPMVESARGWKGGGDLRHAQGHDQRKGAEQRPTQTDGRAPHPAKTELKRGNAAGQDANNGKGNGEIGKRRHPAMQFRLIAHTAKVAFVVGDYCARIVVRIGVRLGFGEIVRHAFWFSAEGGWLLAGGCYRSGGETGKSFCGGGRSGDGEFGALEQARAGVFAKAPAACRASLGSFAGLGRRNSERGRRLCHARGRVRNWRWCIGGGICATPIPRRPDRRRP